MASPIESLINLQQGHAYGLDSELAGKFDLAQELFSDVLRGLGDVPITEETNTPLVVLHARTLRDNAYTSLRRALRFGDPSQELFGKAQAGLREALQVTDPFVSGNEPLPNKNARGELFAAQSSTQGCLGRLVVARQLTSLEITRLAPATDEQREEQHWFSLAHKTAQGGANPYAGASNAVPGARAERVNGLPLPMMSLWLSRGAIFLAQSGSFSDRKHAAATLAGHIPELRSRKAAMAAATHWRHV